MEGALEFFKHMAENWQAYAGAAAAVIAGLIALFMLIPGDQPEKFLQGVLDFLKKFSIGGSKE